eukprot:TRINITY_DN30334_c0_g1_i1.p1 TRINITY_DN30334_c0_g1~~TRINITY_DN30334_c0_g1_i1.p1  ORF type:complete len:264 (-),score=87.74 TRINITY_DN30334_c0_g1_i1:23-814(-)
MFSELVSTTRSSSRSRANRKAEQSTTKLICGDSVEVFGLQSESGKFLNGKTGVITQYIEAIERYEVSFGPEKLVRIKAVNLKKASAPAAPAAPAATPAQAKNAEPKAFSLTSLLGMGAAPAKAEEQPKVEHQTIWERSGTGMGDGTVLTDEQKEMFDSLQGQTEEKRQDEERLRRKVLAEMKQAGISDPDMVEMAYQEELEKMNSMKLLRPQDYKKMQEEMARLERERQGGGAPRRKSSSSSSSSSSSRSRSRSRSKAKEKKS